MLTLEEVEEAGGYSVVYADPSWNYKNAGGNGAAENHYGTMKLKDIQALPVRRLAAPDCALFLWGTYPLLPEMFATAAAWGFEYKTIAFQWIKRNKLAMTPATGGGFWTRANSEGCFLFVRGKPKRINKGVHQLIEELDPEVLDTIRGEHSAKPAMARDKIVELMGDVLRIELFGRERFEGWDVWGDDPKIGEPDVQLICAVDDSRPVGCSSGTFVVPGDGDGSITDVDIERHHREAAGL